MMGELVRRFLASKAQVLGSGLFGLVDSGRHTTASVMIATCLFFVVEFLLQQPLAQNFLKCIDKDVIRVKQADQRPNDV